MHLFSWLMVFSDVVDSVCLESYNRIGGSLGGLLKELSDWYPRRNEKSI